MITVLDKTSGIFDAFVLKCNRDGNNHLPFYVIKTYNLDTEYRNHNNNNNHYKYITKTKFYNEIGFTECDESQPDISYYIPFDMVYDNRGAQDHNLRRTYRQLFYECNHFDIIIGEGKDVKYVKNQIRIRTTKVGTFEVDNVYLNGELIPSVNYDLTSTIKFALRKCIAEIMADMNEDSEISELNSEISELKDQLSNANSEISELKGEILNTNSEISELKSQLDECKKLIMDQNNQLRSKIMQVFSLVDSTESDALKKENEELKQYKKSVEQIIGLSTRQ